MARLISSIRVQGFRSIRSATLDDLDEYVPIIGLNSTGKSNILRALNLFFTGFVDENRQPPDFLVDYPDFIAGNRQKRLSVTITIDLSTGFNVRGSNDFLDRHQIEDDLVIERFWTLGPNRIDLLDSIRVGPTIDALALVSDLDRQNAQTIIQAIQFRYIPNHVRPADLMQSEAQDLRAKLINRLRRTRQFRDGNVDETMTALSEVANRMFDPVSEAVAKGSSGRQLRPDIPSDFADLAFQVGIRSVTEGGKVQATSLQGSGTQSFMLLHILGLLDSTVREQSFGWRQFSVWGMEEPESFLHAGLRAQFATDLETFAQDPRRQVFLSTHQDEFVRVAENAWLVEMGDSAASSVEKLSARDAILRSSRMRISSYTHPLMSFPDQPLVIVEGKFDAIYLDAAVREAGLRPRWRVGHLEALDPGQSGGDHVKTYLQANRSVVASRPLDAPIFMLRDWEEGDGKIDSLSSVLRDAHPYSACWKCPPDLTNPELDSSFRGIEKYLTTSAIEDVVPPAQLRPASREELYPLHIDGGVLSSRKSDLARRVEDGGEVGEFMVRLAAWLDTQVGEAFGDLPPRLF